MMDFLLKIVFGSSKFECCFNLDIRLVRPLTGNHLVNLYVDGQVMIRGYVKVSVPLRGII